MGTDHGLCSFDSEQWTYYTKAEGLPDGMLVELKEERETGRIWMKGLNQTLSVLNPETGIITVPEFNKELNLSSAHHLLSAWDIDEQGNGFLLVYTFMNSKKKHVGPFRKYLLEGYLISDSSTLSLPRYQAFALTEGQTKHWVYNRAQGLKAQESKFKYDSVASILWHSGISLPGNFKPETVRGSISFLPLKNGRLVSAINRHLLVIDPLSASVLWYKQMEADVVELYEDKKQDLWVSLKDQEGIRVFKGGNISRKADEYLKGLTVTSFFDDRDGNFWLGTKEKGVMHFSNIPFQKMALPENAQFVSQIRNVDQRTFAVTNYTNAYEIVQHKDSISWQRHMDQRVGLTDFWCVNDTFFYCEKRQLFMGYENAHWTLGPNDFKGIIRGVPLSKSKAFGYSNIQYAQFDGITKNRDYSSLDYNIYLRVNCAKPFSDSKILIGTAKGTQIVSKEGFRSFGNDLLPTDHIYDIDTDKWGNFWIATKGNGLYRLSADTLSCTAFTTGSGLPRNAVKDIEITADGKVYGITEGGLFAITHYNANIGSGKIKVWNTADGFVPNQLKQLSSSNQHLFMRTNQNLWKAPLRELEEDQYSRRVYLKKLWVNNLSKQKSEILELEHGENNVKIQFGSFHYGQKKPEYWYSLSRGEHWIPTKDLELNLVNLEAGQHTVLVASSPEFLPSRDLKLSFSIAEPFTSSLLFSLLVFLIGGALVFFVFWVFLMRARLERSLLVSQQQALTAQMNPHFIFNALNSIYYFVGRKEKIEAQNYLSEFAFLMRQVLNSSRSGTVTLENEVKSLKTYLELEELRFNQSHTIVFEIAEELQSRLPSIEIPGMIVQPYLENAIVHGLLPKTEPGKLLFKLDLDGQWLVILIEDNGVGRGFSIHGKKAKNHTSHGSSITQERIDLLNKKSRRKISAYTEDLVPGGTRVTLQIPI